MIANRTLRNTLCQLFMQMSISIDKDIEKLLSLARCNAERIHQDQEIIQSLAFVEQETELSLVGRNHRPWFPLREIVVFFK